MVNIILNMQFKRKKDKKTIPFAVIEKNCFNTSLDPNRDLDC